MSRRLVAGVVAAFVVVAAVLWWRLDSGERRVSAVLPSAVSLFEGSDVKIMGVRVGEVTRVTPRGTSVLVEMEYDDDYTLPADAEAVVVSPSVIGDRFVQLTPPGSACSIAIGQGVTDSAPGLMKGLQLVVESAEAAHAELSGRGVEVGEVQDFPWGRFVFFSDPDGNAWAVQEIQPPRS